MKAKILGEIGLKSYEEGHFNKGNAKSKGKGYKRQTCSIRIRKELETCQRKQKR